VQRTAGSGFVDGVTIQSNVSPATTACPTFSDVPNSGKTILLPSGTVAMNWNAGYYSSAGALGVTFRACFGATCGGSQNYMTNEALSHKMASGSWVTSAASGSTLVKLQICRNTGTGAITMDGNDTVSWTVIQ
jgi:hypothetical protein